MGFLNNIYSVCPAWTQNLGVSLYGFYWKRRRHGGVFKNEVEAYLAREKFGPSQWSGYQTQRLQDLLRSSYQNVPYYRALFKTAGINEQTLAGFQINDLPKIPLLEKETLRKNSAQFLSAKGPKTSAYLSSGTTGTPIAFHFSERMHQEWSAAYEVRCRRWAGLNYQMSRAMIGGRLVVTKAHSKPPFWRYNRAERQLYFSAFHISPANAPHYVSALNRYKPDYLVGYAYSHYSLARMILETGLSVHQPKAVLTSSEKLTSEMRQVIEKAYSCKVFDAYSGVEACCLSSECEHHNMHLSPDVGIVELIGANGQPVPAGQPGEIVATGLLNYEQPLIRYRTGDYAVLSEDDCSCGRQMPILKELIGRLEDAVIARDGREMVRFHGIFVGLPHVREGQVIQEEIDHIRLKLVTDPGFTASEKNVIAKRFEERLGTIKLTFDLVDQIEKTERGKFRAVISKVKQKK